MVKKSRVKTPSRVKKFQQLPKKTKNKELPRLNYAKSKGYNVFQVVHKFNVFINS